MAKEQNPGAGDHEQRVERVMALVRAGVRQRQAELATIDKRMRELPASIVRLNSVKYLEEPVCSSHRPIVGHVIVLAKQAVYQLFMKWHLRSVRQQQNAFNQTLVRAMLDVVERQKDLAHAIDQLAKKVDVIEERPGGGGP